MGKKGRKKDTRQSEKGTASGKGAASVPGPWAGKTRQEVPALDSAGKFSSLVERLSSGPAGLRLSLVERLSTGHAQYLSLIHI